MKTMQKMHRFFPVFHSPQTAPCARFFAGGFPKAGKDTVWDFKHKEPKKSFLMAFTITLCVLILTAGMIAVDYQGRKLSFGDDTPPFSVHREEDRTELAIRLFGVNQELDITKIDEFWRFLCDFGCLPHS